MAEFVGVPCPVSNCQGFLKQAEEASGYPYVCEYGHVVDEVEEKTSD
jgi:hypothetical protein